MKGTASELGTENIGKLLLQYSVPAIIAMTASSLYNMVDSIFIGQGVGALAISGLAVTFPLMNLSAAFGSMVGVGASTLISVKLGQHDFKTAQHILGNVVTLNLILGALFGAAALWFLDSILYFFGASEATLPYARDYMVYILLGNIITHLYFGLNAVLRSSGHPRSAMTATILTVIVNTILDPLFIYGFGLGIKGAAIATVFSQLISLAWQLRLLSNKDELIHFKRGIYKPQQKIVKDTIAIGLSPFLMNSCACLVVVLINRGLAEYGGDLAIGAYGIINRVLFVVVMIVMGLNQGMQPIAGYNYGAQAFDRMLQVLRYTIYGATAITTTGALIAELFPEYCVRAFTTDAQLTVMAIRGMRIVAIFFPIIGFQMATANFFQSIGHAGKSIFLSLSRQLLILVPLLLILPKIWGLDGVWYAMPASDLCASLIAGAMLYTQSKKFR
ncbi:MAG: MATE family efflux transporter [Paraprevotella sp.]|nr:MATE family efflux transporter [Paraprevotella sp.]